MVYLLLGLVAVTVTCQSVFQQRFNTRTKGSVLFFGAMISLFAMIFFLAVNRDWSWNPILLLPAGGFAAGYATCTVFTVLAIRHGSLAKTTFMISCSLLIPSFYGILFLNEHVSVTLVIGILLLIVALWLINYEKKDENTRRMTWKWVLFVSLAFVGNGMCSVVQKAEQMMFGTDGKDLFMILALAMVTVSLLILSFVFKEERMLCLNTLQKGWYWALLCGFANGLTNSLVLYLNTLLPASLMFPVISAGGIILSFLYSTVIVKERFDLRQKIGFLIGVISVVLLNI